MTRASLKIGNEYVIDFNSKKVSAIYIGQRRGVLFFIDNLKLKLKNEDCECKIPDYLIDKQDQEVSIIKKSLKNKKTVSKTVS